MITADIRLSNLIAPHFYNVHRDIKAHGHTEYTLYGGRGSTKSSFVGVEIPMLMKQNPQMHALVCRQVKDTLKDSVYAQIEWGVNALGLQNEFKFKKSPLEIIYIPTGQTIFFRGMDDVYKLKSIKPSFGYIGILWFEELDTFNGPEAIRNVEQSAMRGGDKFFEFKTFNPPQSKNNWANMYVLQEKPNMLAHKSDYRSVPVEWLGQHFFDEAEWLKETNPHAYEHEYLGIPNGNGGMVFDNLELRTITDEEINTLDRTYGGNDWGFFPDPLAYIHLAYVPRKETIYLLDEFGGNKLSNRQAAEQIINLGYWKNYQYGLICDSAEPKSISDYVDLGIWNAKAAYKPPDSVAYTMKWLSRRKIVIDIKRTPRTYKEFTEYEYARDKEGNIISGYPDANNHFIDAVRYALNPVIYRRTTQA